MTTLNHLATVLLASAASLALAACGSERGAAGVDAQASLGSIDAAAVTDAPSSRGTPVTTPVTKRVPGAGETLVLRGDEQDEAFPKSMREVGGWGKNRIVARLKVIDAKRVIMGTGKWDNFAPIDFHTFRWEIKADVVTAFGGAPLIGSAGGVTTWILENGLCWLAIDPFNGSDTAATVTETIPPYDAGSSYAPFGECDYVLSNQGKVRYRTTWLPDGPPWKGGDIFVFASREGPGGYYPENDARINHAFPIVDGKVDLSAMRDEPVKHVPLAQLGATLAAELTPAAAP